jgi:hypothetical protein
MTVAGLHEGLHPLGPKHWRHVVYIAEDVAQVQRIVAGMVEHGGLGITHAEVRERFHLVAARRMSPEDVAAGGADLPQAVHAHRCRRGVAPAGCHRHPKRDHRGRGRERQRRSRARSCALFKQHFD